MAVLLEDYVRNQMPARKSEIEQIGETAGAVFNSFSLAFDHVRNAWPYRLDRDQRPAAADKYSFSTNAMVLFALRALLGDFQSSVVAIAGAEPLLRWSSGNVGLLTPMLARPDEDLIASIAGKDVEPESKRELWARLRQWFRPLVEKTTAEIAKQINEEIARSGRLTGSGTFGRNDPFTLSWILEAVNLEDAWIDQLRERAFTALETPWEFKLETQDNLASAHALPLLRGLQMYCLLRRLGRCDERPLIEIRDWFEGRLHEHLSYASIPDSSFDAPETIFALEGLLICEPQSLGIERLLKRVLDVVQEKQQHNPNLRPYRPILSDERGRALLPLTIEVFSSLLRISERLASDDSRAIDFGAVHSILKRYAQWLLGQRSLVPISEGSVSGWSSEHTNTRHCIHVWETSQVLLFLVHYRALLREQLQRDLLDAANFTRARPMLKTYMPQTEVDCEKSEPCRPVQLYRAIWTDFIAPRASLRTSDAKYSLLLFGPPGTGKTTFAEYLAAMLGWELIILSPSDFIERGDQGVEARAKVIFSSLQELSEKVVLFDEIDRLLLDRDSPEYARQDDIFQFMTPSMLTKLRTLRRLERCIFVVATNYEDRIDPAAKRHGRIDDRIPVLPPDKLCREGFLTKQLEDRNWNRPSHESWKAAVEKSALFTFPELNDAIKRTFAGRALAQEAFDGLVNYISERTPEIRLATYTSRFGLELVDGKRLPKPPQVPIIEFTYLCDIARENPALKDRADEIMKKIDH